MIQTVAALYSGSGLIIRAFVVCALTAVVLAGCGPDSTTPSYQVLVSNESDMSRVVVLRNGSARSGDTWSAAPQFVAPPDGQRRAGPTTYISGPGPDDNHAEVLILDTDCHLISTVLMYSGIFDVTLQSDDRVDIRRLPSTASAPPGPVMIGKLAPLCDEPGPTSFR